MVNLGSPPGAITAERSDFVTNPAVPELAGVALHLHTHDGSARLNMRTQFPIRANIEIAEHHDPVSRVKNAAEVDVGSGDQAFEITSITILCRVA